jgi:hypothetical protein
MRKVWGIYDTVDGVWMGDDKGPVTYADEWVAKIAAHTLDVRLRQNPGRNKAIEFTDKNLRLRDTVETKMTTEEALKLIEDGIV